MRFKRGDFGFDARAVEVYRQVVKAAPLYHEAYAQALRAAERTGNVDDIRWATVGILSQAWPENQKSVPDAALRIATRDQPVHTFKRITDADLAEALRRWAPRVPDLDPEKDLATIERLGGGFLIPGDEHWPTGLDDLPDAPYGLWYRGNITGGIPAGDRMCDASLTATSDGRATTLFAAMRGTRHTLLLLPGDEKPADAGPLLEIAADVARAFPGMLATHLILRPGTTAPMSIGDAAAWFDTTHRLHEKLHATAPTLVLVRPDGYVGYRSQPADGAGLRAYLGGYLIGG